MIIIFKEVLYWDLIDEIRLYNKIDPLKLITFSE